MNVTPWFPPEVLPVYTGWFERDYVITKPRFEKRWFRLGWLLPRRALPAGEFRRLKALIRLS